MIMTREQIIDLFPSLAEGQSICISVVEIQMVVLRSTAVYAVDISTTDGSYFRPSNLAYKGEIDWTEIDKVEVLLQAGGEVVFEVSNGISA